MKIAIIGYGKMGMSIEEAALARGHEVLLKASREDILSDMIIDLGRSDMAFEFSEPGSAYQNIMTCFEARVPVVCGTTGWNGQLDHIRQVCKEKKLSFFYASNYSIGVNLFYEINKLLAKLMNDQKEFDEVIIHESHHIQKLDSPSGTSIALAQQILERIDRLSGWKNYKSDENYTFSGDTNDELPIFSTRKGDLPGTHIVKYFSDNDEIEIIHKALSRKGFAQGALAAGEWLLGKEGSYGMSDLLRF